MSLSFMCQCPHAHSCPVVHSAMCEHWIRWRMYHTCTGVDGSWGLVNTLDGALCLLVFTALAPGLVGLMLLGRSLDWKVYHPKCFLSEVWSFAVILGASMYIINVYHIFFNLYIYIMEVKFAIVDSQDKRIHVPLCVTLYYMYIICVVIILHYIVVWIRYIVEGYVTTCYYVVLYCISLRYIFI